jgi:hypothetical protein
MSHKINRLSFGPQPDFGEMMAPSVNPLTGFASPSVQDQNLQLLATYKLDIAEMETVSPAFDNKPLSHFDYRYAFRRESTNGMGGVWFQFDMSPTKIHYRFSQEPFSDFVTNLCSIVGGLFAAAGILESLVRHFFKEVL